MTDVGIRNTITMIEERLPEDLSKFAIDCIKKQSKTRSIIKLVDADIDGCGTGIDVLLEINADITRGMITIIENAIGNCKNCLEGEWTTDDVVDSVIEALEKVYELEVKVISPIVEIEF